VVGLATVVIVMGDVKDILNLAGTPGKKKKKKTTTPRRPSTYSSNSNHHTTHTHLASHSDRYNTMLHRGPKQGGV
jgi:hypothetical protein